MSSPNVIGVVSGKGGVGKTTTAINFSTALHDFREEVTLVDANLKNPNVLLHLDLPHVPIALQHVLNDGIDIRHTIRVHHSGLRIVPSLISFNQRDANLENLKHVVRQLEGTVVIDAPAGIDEDTKHIINATNQLLVVLTPDVPAVTDAAKTIKYAKEINKKIVGLVVNRVKNDAYELTPDEIEIMCETPIIASIPEDDNIRKSIFSSTPVVRYNPYSPATVQYQSLAAKLLSIPYDPPRSSLWRRLLSVF
ncbi:Iron-sulfur cluster carrier protein [uncultured archaeon]|nr:Iron-sulfur cluster carrier protein [uncultured archaeon]